MKTRMVLIDGFANHDIARLTELLGRAFVTFTSTELQQLATIPAVIISREWFMDYDYALDNASGEKTTEFYNPTTLENNHFLHAWRVFSTSPFEQACVFTSDTPSVTSVTVTPSTATTNAGQKVQLSATVVTTGFANKAVLWTTESEDVIVDQNGLVTIKPGTTAGDYVVTATSIYDNTKSGTATITVA